MRQYAIFHHYPSGGTIMTSDLWLMNHYIPLYYSPIYYDQPIHIGYGHFIYYPR